MVARQGRNYRNQCCSALGHVSSGHGRVFQALKRCNALPILPNLSVPFLLPYPCSHTTLSCAPVKSRPCSLQASHPQSNLPRPTFHASELVVHAIPISINLTQPHSLHHEDTQPLNPQCRSLQLPHIHFVCSHTTTFLRLAHTAISSAAPCSPAPLRNQTQRHKHCSDSVASS